MRLYLENSGTVDASGSSFGICQCLLQHFMVSRCLQKHRVMLTIQLTHPKLQKIQQKAPTTTSHAFRPPSGNWLGSQGSGKLGFSMLARSSCPENDFSESSCDSLGFVESSFSVNCGRCCSLLASSLPDMLLSEFIAVCYDDEIF
jgi:hypothetical protein